MAIHLQSGDTVCLSGSSRLRRDQLRSMASAAGIHVAKRPGPGVTCVRGLYSLSRDRRRPNLPGLRLHSHLSEPAFVAQCERLRHAEHRKAVARGQVAAILQWLDDPGEESRDAEPNPFLRTRTP